MATTHETPVSPAEAGVTMTAGKLRELLRDLADGAPVMVGMYSDQHFNALIGTMSVKSARVMPGSTQAALILGVASMS
jgi:hypothetical protein